MVRNFWFASLMLVTCPIILTLHVTVQQFKESPGFYYDHLREVRLYHTEWKVISYINLETVDGNFELVKNYAVVRRILQEA